MKLDSTVITNRALLRRIMEQNGFTALETEWWHYSWSDTSTNFEVLDIDFKKLKALAVKNSY